MAKLSTLKITNYNLVLRSLIEGKISISDFSIKNTYIKKFYFKNLKLNAIFISKISSFFELNKGVYKVKKTVSSKILKGKIKDLKDLIDFNFIICELPFNSDIKKFNYELEELGLKIDKEKKTFASLNSFFKSNFFQNVFYSYTLKQWEIFEKKFRTLWIEISPKENYSLKREISYFIDKVNSIFLFFGIKEKILLKDSFIEKINFIIYDAKEKQNFIIVKYEKMKNFSFSLSFFSENFHKIVFRITNFFFIRPMLFFLGILIASFVVQTNFLVDPWNALYIFFIISISITGSILFLFLSYMFTFWILIERKYANFIRKIKNS